MWRLIRESDEAIVHRSGLGDCLRQLIIIYEDLEDEYIHFTDSKEDKSCFTFCTPR